MAAPAADEVRNEAQTRGHEPYVPDDRRIPEFTVSAVLLGAVLGIVFGASSLYLVLKVGMTVSASIPVAVLSITLFRAFSRVTGVRRATILENNIVQTTGSAGESIAFGVGVTMPALMLLGFEMEVSRVLIVSVLGGLLGILMMIPLRRAFIVRQHGVLKYPEGTACADVLIVGEQGGASAKTVFVGFGLALLYQVLWQGMRLWKDTARRSLDWFVGATAAIEVSPALLGVGYIIGPKIAAIMVGGGVLASFVLIPAIRFFGSGTTEAIYPATAPIAAMSESDLWGAYVLYIGAGAVAAGGIISLIRALPLILSSIQAGLRDVRGAEGGPSASAVRRTDHDLSLRVVGMGALLLVAMVWIYLTFSTAGDAALSPASIAGTMLGAVLIVLFGFLFVTVSSRLTGEIGSSSNPISGMTVATLLLTCLIFLLLGWTAPEHRLLALTVAAIVCIAASNGGTTSQDLKTGYLVGGTPRYQQIGIMIGAFSSALVIGWILVVLNEAATVYSTRDLPALSQPLDVGQLDEIESAPDDPAQYHVWRVGEGNEQGVPPGKYLVNDRGEIRYLVDPGINGRLARRDDGTEVQKFQAPKARLMSLITDGILTQKLPWTLVLLGVSIALVLELCGVPSLPFAVGVYLPLSASTPIFTGGMVRLIADRFARGAAGGRRTESESDMSSGVLLSTGYIAGGAIGGVLIAFLSFSDTIPRHLAQWEYATTPAADAPTLDAQYEAAAAERLGLAATSIPENRRGEVASLAEEIQELNADQLPVYIQVPAGTVVRLPGNRAMTAEDRTSLGQIAEDKLGASYRATLLADLNPDLARPDRLPPGSPIKLPHHDWPALATFGALALLLLVVGLGWWLSAPVAAHQMQPKDMPGAP